MSFKNIKVKDFSSICRICLKRPNILVSVTEQGIIKKISSCTSVNISLNDGLPNHVCQDCLTELQKAYKFKTLAEVSNNRLWKILYEHNLGETIVVKIDPDEIYDGANRTSDGDITDSVQHENNTAKLESETKKNDDKSENKTNCTVQSANIKDSCNKKEVQTDLSCNTCGKKFTNICGLSRHRLVHNPEQPCRCNQCGKSFNAKFVLLRHMRKDHSDTFHDPIKVPCNVCAKLIKKGNMQLHMKIHENDRNLIKCNQCPKQFLRQQTLVLHIRREHDNIPRILKYLCNVCGRKTGSPAELKIHMISHSDKKTFSCDKCDMKYKTPHGLKHHVNTTHLNIRPHVCTVCSKTFSLKSLLADHFRIHTGERPFQCVICQKTFSHKSAFQTHTRLVHNKKKFN